MARLWPFPLSSRRSVVFQRHHLDPPLILYRLSIYLFTFARRHFEVLRHVIKTFGCARSACAPHVARKRKPSPRAHMHARKRKPRCD